MTAAGRLEQYVLTAALLVAGMLLGLAAQSLIASYFGAGSDSDALFMARDIADLALKLLLPTQAAGVLIPAYLAARAARGDDAAAGIAAGVLTLAVVVAVPLVVLVMVAAAPLVALLAPGFDDATAATTERLVRIVAGIALLTLLSTLAAALLQARQRFGQAMLTQIAGGAAMLVALPILVPVLGVDGAAVAMLAGAAVQTLASGTLLWRNGLPLFGSPRRARSDIADFVRRWASFLPLAGAGQVSGIVFRVSVSTLGTGAYAIVSLAWRMFRAMLTLMLTPVQYVLLPALAHGEAEGRRADADAEFVATLRQVLYLISPLVAGFVVLREPAVSLVFQHGEFTADSSQTATVTAILALAIVPTGCYMLLEQAALARRRSRLVARANLVVEVIQALTFYPLVVLLGASGVAVAGGLGVLAINAIYFFALRPAGADPRQHLDFLWRLVACTAALVTATVLAREGAESLVGVSGHGAALVTLCAATGAGALAYVAASHWLRIREPQVLRAAARDMLAAPRRR